MHLRNPRTCNVQHSRRHNSTASENKWNEIRVLKVKVVSFRSLFQAITSAFSDSWLDGLLSIEGFCMTESAEWLVLEHMLFMSSLPFFITVHLMQSRALQIF